MAQPADRSLRLVGQSVKEGGAIMPRMGETLSEAPSRVILATAELQEFPKRNATIATDADVTDLAGVHELVQMRPAHAEQLRGGRGGEMLVGGSHDHVGTATHIVDDGRKRGGKPGVRRQGRHEGGQIVQIGRGDGVRLDGLHSGRSIVRGWRRRGGPSVAA